MFIFNANVYYNRIFSYITITIYYKYLEQITNILKIYGKNTKK